jgi:MFS family permease
MYPAAANVVIRPTFMLSWGIMAILCTCAKTFASAVTVRFFLGMFEGLYGPCTAIYCKLGCPAICSTPTDFELVSTFYKRNELGKRIAIYYSSTALSGAFSGLLAYGIFHIQSKHIQGWQLLFLIEGGLY